jgi:acetyltransferase-like isoleucine patch superfamily enzyme
MRRHARAPLATEGGMIDKRSTGAALRARIKPLAGRALTAHVPVVGPLRPLFRLLYAAHVGVRESVEQGLRFFWYEPLLRSQCESVGSGFRMEQLPYVWGTGHIVIGERVRLSGKSAISFHHAGEGVPELRIGDDSFVGHDCSLAIAWSISIGRHVLVAGGVRISDYDGHPVDAAARRAGDPTPPDGVRPVVVEDDVWIGTDARILKGVRIGARSIVGSGAVVTRSVPPDVVVAGNPARIVRRLAASPEDLRERLS